VNTNWTVYRPLGEKGGRASPHEEYLEMFQVPEPRTSLIFVASALFPPQPITPARNRFILQQSPKSSFSCPLYILPFFILFIFTMPMGDRDNRGPSPLRPPTTPFRIESLISPIDSEYHPVIHAGRVAVITGGASGIGRAAARELAR
jgi:hypothetical protein